MSEIRRPPVSMSGFGTGAFELAGRSYRVQARSVNHKSVQVRLHVPRELTPAEPRARRRVQERLQRGAVDVWATLEAAPEGEATVEVDRAGARRLMGELGALARELDAAPPDLGTVARLGDLVRTRSVEVDEEAAAEAFLEGLDRALDGVLAMRANEGAALGADLAERLDRLRELVERIDEEAPAVRRAHEQRLRQRLEEALGRHTPTAGEAGSGTAPALDEGRLATELVLYADRVDVTEETVRARTHLDRFDELLGRSARGASPNDADAPSRSDEGAGRVGKRMDFLAQELGREFNTIGSKCRHAGIAGSVVDAKVELERIREQIHNIA